MKEIDIFGNIFFYVLATFTSLMLAVIMLADSIKDKKDVGITCINVR